MQGSLASYSGNLAKVEGGARTGKTEALVQRTAALLADGTDPSSILVTVASNFARECFINRLEAAVRPDLALAAHKVRVARPIDICCDLLNTKEGVSFTGRHARILSDVEYLFFIEDLKTLGQRNQRLANMLMFFFAQWSNYLTEEEWLIQGEETTVLGLARELLVEYDAMLRHEAPYLCAKLLDSEAGASLCKHYDFVLADDFQNYSLAEQRVVSRCVSKQFIVAGCVDQTTKVNTDYPCQQGFSRFERTRKGVAVFTLDGAYAPRVTVQAAEQLLKRNPASTCADAEANAAVVSWESPEDELTGIKSLVQSYLDANASADMSDVIIAVPTKRWGKVVSAALRRQSLPVCTGGLDPRIGGDPRGAGYHDAMSAYAHLMLAADGKDLMAWRIVVGFDDALTNSDLWDRLRRRAKATGISMLDQLRVVAEADSDVDPIVSAKLPILKNAWSYGQDIIQQTAGLIGEELAHKTGLAARPEFSDVLRLASGNETASELLALVRLYFVAPWFSATNDALRVVLYENLCGVQAGLLVLCGMVDGLMPDRRAVDPIELKEDRDKLLETERVRLYSALTKGREYVVVTLSRTSDVETAERTKMQVKRISSVAGQRVAQIAPSCFLEESGLAGVVAASEETDFTALFEV